MTKTPFTCATFADQLSAYLERDDTPAVRDAMESHAGLCAECGALLADIAAIQEAAANLPTLRPTRDLWAGIEVRIEAPVVPITAGGARATAAPAARRGTWIRPAIAAAALVAITAGVTHVATRQALRAPVEPSPRVAVVEATPIADPIPTSPIPSRIEAGPPAPAAAASLSARVTAPEAMRPRASQSVSRAAFAAFRQGEMAPLDSLYYREILRLRSIVSERRTGLDSTTVQVLDRNLAVIDRAIRECRAALARDPASHFLNEQLNQALESKIELLRAAATVPIGS